LGYCFINKKKTIAIVGNRREYNRNPSIEYKGISTRLCFRESCNMECSVPESAFFPGTQSSMEGVLPSRTLLHEDHCFRECTLPWRVFFLREHFYMKITVSGSSLFLGERFSFENTFT
jgi:hypothetical protein